MKKIVLSALLMVLLSGCGKSTTAPSSSSSYDYPDYGTGVDDSYHPPTPTVTPTP